MRFASLCALVALALALPPKSEHHDQREAPLTDPIVTTASLDLAASLQPQADPTPAQAAAAAEPVAVADAEAPSLPEEEHSAGAFDLRWNVHKEGVYQGEAATHVDQKNCHTVRNRSPLDHSKFCNSDGCWPALWLLGAQKAATSAVYDVLEQCGVIAGAWPTQQQTGKDVPEFCVQPCKETHFWTGPFEEGDELNKWARITGGKRPMPSGTLDLRQVTQYTKMHMSGNSCNARVTYKEKEACRNARFLEGTPTTEHPLMPSLLASAMPRELIGHARFVIILREPIERLLSWYNHNKCPYETKNGAPWDYCSKEHNTFHGYAECKKSEGVREGADAGFYGPFVDNLLEMPGVSRQQLLILNYRDSFKDSSATRNTIEAVTKHYGGPVLDSVFEMPESNAKEYPQKLVQIKCATRDALEERYRSSSAELYDRIESGYKNNMAPEHEPRFNRFVVDVPCGYEERSQGLVKAMTLASNGTDNTFCLTDTEGCGLIAGALPVALNPAARLSLGSSEGPRGLEKRVPLPLLATARFIVILREPIARALAHFNRMRSQAYGAHDGGASPALGSLEHPTSCFLKAQNRANVSDGSVSFHSVAACALSVGSDPLVTHGRYDDALRRWTSHYNRNQLMLVPYDELASQPEALLAKIAAHAGAPPGVAAASTAATRDAAASSAAQHAGGGGDERSVRVVRCDTLAELRRHFLPLNERFYRRLFDDYHLGRAPPEEKVLEPSQSHP